MTARVVAYSAHQEDEHLTIMVECLACGIEFGWSRDLPAANDRLDALVEIHNREYHS